MHLITIVHERDALSFAQKGLREVEANESVTSSFRVDDQAALVANTDDSATTRTCSSRCSACHRGCSSGQL